MLIIYTNYNLFYQKYQTVLPFAEKIETFDKNSYIIEVKDQNMSIFAVKGIESDITKVFGSSSLVFELLDNIHKLGLSFKKVDVTTDLIIHFQNYYKLELKYNLGICKNIITIKERNIKTCLLAGGCFWCSSKPYYEYNGILHVYSGFSGGEEIMPTYESVKHQQTHHLETIKIVYDENIISLKEILDIFFFTIDPFDDGGQFIDRGNSYRTAIFYQNQEMKEYIENYINKLQQNFEKKIVVRVLEEKVFYMAEELHQDYAIKNPDKMMVELIESGRIKRGDLNENN